MTSPISTSRKPARRPSQTGRRILAVTSLGLAGLLAGLLSGCSTQIAATPTSTSSFAQVSGNWQFTSAPGARLSSVGGNLTVSGTDVSGILHPLLFTKQCLTSPTPILVTGSIDASRRLTLSGPVAGGTLNLSGTVSADSKTLTAPTFSVSGGTCVFQTAQTSLQTVTGRDTSISATAQQYQPVNGTYTGTLTTSDGQTFNLTSVLTQTSQPDTDGVYHVSGTAASPGNTCIPTSLPATASTIDGGSISTTYTDATTGTSITATGSTSPDGTSIAISTWTINSPCGSDTGTGTLTLH